MQPRADEGICPRTVDFYAALRADDLGACWLRSIDTLGLRFSCFREILHFFTLLYGYPVLAPTFFADRSNSPIHCPLALGKSDMVASLAADRADLSLLSAPHNEHDWDKHDQHQPKKIRDISPRFISPLPSFTDNEKLYVDSRVRCGLDGAGPIPWRYQSTRHPLTSGSMRVP